jgi:hypothetical protein
MLLRGGIRETDVGYSVVVVDSPRPTIRRGDCAEWSRSPWQIHFVPQYEDGCAVIGRFHHCVGDGLAMLYMLHMMTNDPPVVLTEAPSVLQPTDTHKTPAGLLKRPLSPLVTFTRSEEESLVRAVKAINARPASVLDAIRAPARAQPLALHFMLCYTEYLLLCVRSP